MQKHKQSIHRNIVTSADAYTHLDTHGDTDADADAGANADKDTHPDTGADALQIQMQSMRRRPDRQNHNQYVRVLCWDDVCASKPFHTLNTLANEAINNKLKTWQEKRDKMFAVDEEQATSSSD